MEERKYWSLSSVELRKWEFFENYLDKTFASNPYYFFYKVEKRDYPFLTVFIFIDHNKTVDIDLARRLISLPSDYFSIVNEYYLKDYYYFSVLAKI
jgi:hypothetical protein